jgi:hypothetical protein
MKRNRDPLMSHLLSADTGWMADASCAVVPWLPWTETRPDRRDVFALREVCADCPVRTDCERFAVDAGVTAGWWAGRSFNLYAVGHPAAQEGDAA